MSDSAKRGIGRLIDVIDRDVAILLKRTQKDKESLDLMQEWAGLLNKELDILTTRDETAAALRDHVGEGDPLADLFSSAMDLTSQRIRLIIRLILTGMNSMVDANQDVPKVTAHLQSLRERVMNKL
jgi:hypothetical protein